MATETKPRTRKAPAKKATAKAPAETKAENTEQAEKKGRKSSVVTESVVKKITEVVTKAGAEGMTLNDIKEATGLTYRQVHNATWRMEGSPTRGLAKKPDERVLSRVNTDRKVRYALRDKGTPEPVMRNEGAVHATRGLSTD